MKSLLIIQNKDFDKSLSSRRAWIEMFVSKCDDERTICRSPRGERGLKLSAICQRILKISRSPRGERGLKFERVKSAGYTPVRRSPRGERGLKYITYLRSRSHYPSLSSRRAWIEIYAYQKHF